MKKELVRILGKMKGIVQKNEAFPAVAGVLVSDGYFIGTNLEIAVKVRSEDAKDEKFLIPMEAFDLINNLPDEDVEIKADDKSISIKTSAIRNKFLTHDPEGFSVMNMGKMVNILEVDGLQLTDAINSVIFAASDSGKIKGIHMAQKGDKYIVEASDGRVLARSTVDIQGEGMDVIIPKTAAKKILSVGLYGKVKIAFGKMGIQFATESCTIASQLYAGRYPDLDRIMNAEATIEIGARRKDVHEAIVRANACITSQEKTPVKLDLAGETLTISIADSRSQFIEELPIEHSGADALTIGFDSKLCMGALKAFNDEKITMGFLGKDMPSIWSSENTEMKAAILPINIGGGK